MTHFESKWHFWSKQIVIPNSLWKEWGTQNTYFAIVKGVADGNDLYSFEDGFYDYVQDYDNVRDLYIDHKSPHGVNIIVWAEGP